MTVPVTQHGTAPPPSLSPPPPPLPPRMILLPTKILLIVRAFVEVHTVTEMQPRAQLFRSSCSLTHLSPVGTRRLHKRATRHLFGSQGMATVPVVTLVDDTWLGTFRLADGVDAVLTTQLTVSLSLWSLKNISGILPSLLGSGTLNC